MGDLPVVCTLPPAERQAQRDDLLPVLLRHAAERERKCCRFFRFQIALEPNLGPITLDVSGHADAKVFLANLPA
jgi:hypothetical protein